MSYKDEIAEILISRGGSLTEAQQKTIDKISDGVEYAWKNWDADIVAPYYAGEKPETAPAKFIKNWIENEDFEADGYDVDRLKELFEVNVRAEKDLTKTDGLQTTQILISGFTLQDENSPRSFDILASLIEVDIINDEDRWFVEATDENGRRYACTGTVDLEYYVEL